MSSRKSQSRSRKNKSKQGKRKTRRTYRRKKTYRGGNPAGSAAAFGEAVYGNPSQQHAIPGSNMIAQNYVMNR